MLKNENNSKSIFEKLQNVGFHQENEESFYLGRVVIEVDGPNIEIMEIIEGNYYTLYAGQPDNVTEDFLREIVN